MIVLSSKMHGSLLITTLITNYLFYTVTIIHIELVGKHKLILVIKINKHPCIVTKLS